VLVVTIASTGKVYVISQIEGIGANLAYATLNRSDISSVLEDELSPRTWPHCASPCPESARAGTYDVPADFQFEGKSFHARLVGVTQDFQKIRNLRITSGRYFDAEDFLAHFRVCLITEKLAQTAVALSRRREIHSPRSIPLHDYRNLPGGSAHVRASEIQDATLLVPFPLVKYITGG